MKGKLILAGVLVLLVAVLYGFPRQKWLAYRLRHADRVLVFNTRLSTNELSAGLTPDDLQSLRQALSASKSLPPWERVASTGDGYRFDVFVGTNRLAAVRTSERIFWVGRKAYLDNQGLLDHIYEKLRTRSQVHVDRE